LSGKKKVQNLRWVWWLHSYNLTLYIYRIHVYKKTLSKSICIRVCMLLVFYRNNYVVAVVVSNLSLAAAVARVKNTIAFFFAWVSVSFSSLRPRVANAARSFYSSVYLFLHHHHLHQQDDAYYSYNNNND